MIPAALLACALNVSPVSRKCRTTSARSHTSRVNGAFRAITRRISASMPGRSSSVNGPCSAVGAKS